MKNYYKNNPDKYEAKNVITRKFNHDKKQRQRDKLAEILGGWRCQNPDCLVPRGCTDKRCLQFEHKNGGGALYYKIFGYHAMLKYYIDHPDEAKRDLQIYCANCNWIKRIKNNENNSIAELINKVN